MEIARTIAAARVAIAAAPRPVGLVPTMGFLHQGHLSLVKAARCENAYVAVSLFVNPTQFGPNEDFQDYPRDFERDATLLREAGVDLLFAPAPDEMYPAGHQTFVVPGPIAETLEGAFRPGHFRGVDTIVAKLFNILQPDRAYFGQKDAQQVAVIRAMVRDLNFPIELRTMPTVREPDGLALSSRNVYLSEEERQYALCLSQALGAAQGLYDAGERDAGLLKEAMRRILGDTPGARVDYVSIADPRSMDEVTHVPAGAVASLAVRIGRTRLIDNVILGGAEGST